jgi:hypothetical protein
MIDYLDRMLAQVIHDQVDPALFVGFQPPDDDWRTKAIPGNANAVNIFLTELRENRRLRSNDRVRTYADGEVFSQMAPRQVDCHYLITTWSPASVTPQVDSTLDEHALLHAIASAFANADPLQALDIFSAVGLPPGMPAALVNDAVPLTLAPVEGFHKYPEFWGTMGRHHQPWKPAIYLITTLPLLLAQHSSGPMVTTAMTDLRDASGTGPEVFFSDIGGTITDTQSPPQPVQFAWVELLTTTSVRLQLVNADASGRFAFSGVPSATYQLRATGAAAGPVTRIVEVPSPTGEYDLKL